MHRATAVVPSKLSGLICTVLTWTSCVLLQRWGSSEGGDPAADGGGGGAVAAHAAMCERFNSTVRLNPKLSLASSMRDIARKSSMRRTSRRNSINGGGGATATPPSACGCDKLSRSSSCALPFV